jgi:ferredoxin
VRIVDGAQNLAPPTEAERKLTARAPIGANERYACQAVVQGDVTITTTYW